MMWNATVVINLLHKNGLNKSNTDIELDIILCYSLHRFQSKTKWDAYVFFFFANDT